ncbi:MAG: polysaccharide biosynthesis/export family protein [Hyphomicrobiaceae bacterium]
MLSKLRRLVFLLLGACLLALAPAEGRAEYIVRSGDVLELKVAGSASMQFRLPIDIDGAARVPLVGSVHVDGMGLDAINETIREKLRRKTLLRVSETGKLIREHFDPEQITVHVAEYRPVYIAGDVVKPGKQPFRPGMTVGQAVALAGGYNLFPNQTAEIQLRSFDWQSELGTLLITMVQHNFRLLRIRSELANAKQPPDFSGLRTTVSAEIVADMAEIETKKFLLNRSKYEKEKKYLQAAISTGKAQLDTLVEQQAKEKGGLDADTKEHQRLLEMAKKGITTSARVTAARRNILFSSTRYLQTTSRISAITRGQDDLRRRLEKLKEDTRSALLEELTVSVAAQGATNQQIKFLLQKLASATGGKQFLQDDAMQVTQKIARRRGGSTIVKKHRSDDLLEPGDLLTIVLKKKATVHNVQN